MSYAERMRDHRGRFTWVDGMALANEADARIAALGAERNDLIQSIRTAIRLLNDGYAVAPLAELESALEAHGGVNHD